MPYFDPDAPAEPGSGIYGLPFTPDESKVVVVPVPFEATTSYGSGAAKGPDAVLAASHQVDLFDLELGEFFQHGIAMLDADPQVVAWNDEAVALVRSVESEGLDEAERARRIDRVNEIGDLLADRVHAAVARWLDQGKIVCVLGGDHSVPFGAMRAYAERFPGMGILHVDAHADLRQAYQGFTHSHASIFFNVMERIPGVAKLVQVGVRDFGKGEYRYIQQSGGRIVTHFDHALARERFAGATWKQQVDRIVRDLPERVYVSFDIDGLDPSLCPHTGTPVPGGLSFYQACELIAGVVESGRTIVGLDLCEVAPGPDGDEWDGNVGARLLYKMIGWALRSQRA